VLTAWSCDAATCRTASGARWAFIGAKLHYPLRGFYPKPAAWRPILALGFGCVRLWRLVVLPQAVK